MLNVLARIILKNLFLFISIRIYVRFIIIEKMIDTATGLVYDI